MTAPTPRQLAILRYIAASIDSRGFPPSGPEMVKAFRFAGDGHSTRDHLYSLARKGLIDTTPRISRGITITSLGRHYAPVRIVTGIVDRPYCRCAGCSREFYGRKNFIAHRCAAADKKAA